jgi:addiction module HigA family antidote
MTFEGTNLDILIGISSIFVIYLVSKDIGIPQTRISQIVKGQRRITADTALRLSKYFGNSAKFWLGLQDDYDLEEEKMHIENLLASIPKAQNNVA